MIALGAGYIAQKRFNPRSVRSWQASSDNIKACQLALYVTDPVGVELLLRWLYHQAENLVKLRWVEIRAVAKALLERKTLTGDELREVIDRALGLPPFGAQK